jgi:hypothetical protein
MRSSSRSRSPARASLAGRFRGRQAQDLPQRAPWQSLAWLKGVPENVPAMGWTVP